MMIVCLLQELGFDVQRPIMVWCDNDSGVQTYTSEVTEWRTPTLATKYWHTKDYVDDRDILVEYIHTDDNNSDIYTKPLPEKDFNRHRAWIGVRPPTTEIESKD